MRNELHNALNRITKGLKFQAADIAPATFGELFSQGRTLTVWSGASDNTIWGEPSLNYKFRAWHDSLHIRTGLDFSVKAELELTRLSLSYFDGNLAEVIRAEVGGQVEHFERFGTFPTDQVAFVIDYAKNGKLGRKF